MELSLVLPCFNEEENLAHTVHKVRLWMEDQGICGEIIVVNDGSTDGTMEVLERVQRETPIPLHIITHATNLGYGATVRAGCDAATTDLIAFMDSDGQFDPRDFDRLLPFLSLPLGGRVSHSAPSSWPRGERGSMNSSTPSPQSSPHGRGGSAEHFFDIVVGRRRKRADPLLRRLNARLFGLLSWAILGIWVRDANCAMKVFRRAAWEHARPTVTTGALFNAEFFRNLRRAGIRWHQVDVPHYARRAGRQTGASPRVILRMLRELWLLRCHHRG